MTPLKPRCFRVFQILTHGGLLRVELQGFPCKEAFAGWASVLASQALELHVIADDDSERKLSFAFEEEGMQEVDQLRDFQLSPDTQSQGVSNT